jgi:hypothetical protein
MSFPPPIPEVRPTEVLVGSIKGGVFNLWLDPGVDTTQGIAFASEIRFDAAGTSKCEDEVSHRHCRKGNADNADQLQNLLYIHAFSIAWVSACVQTVFRAEEVMPMGHIGITIFA